VGAIATGIVADPALGGQGWIDYTVFPPFPANTTWPARSSPAQGGCPYPGVVRRRLGGLFFVVDKIFGLRPSEEAEREGLDLSEHGERAYNY